MIEIAKEKEYQKWLKDLKSRIQSSQIKAAIQVNQQLLKLYWEIGLQILEKEKRSNWGDALIKQLSRDLTNSFPGMKGFSRSNLFYIRKWVSFYYEGSIVQQPVGQFIPNSKITDLQSVMFQIPWGHNVIIITKCKAITEALYYARGTIANYWSRAVLEEQI